MSVLDTLAAATTGSRDVTLIVDKALDAQWRSLLTELDNAQLKDELHASLGLRETTAVIDRMEEIRDQVEASQVTFTMGQLEWHEYVGLQAEHPPRDKKLVDRIHGVNIETWAPALVRESCTAVRGHGEEEPTPADQVPAATWEHLFHSFNKNQMDDLVAGARAVNDQEISVPRSARSLLGTQDSGASLAQPDPGESRRAGSKGGNRRGSQKSSTTKTDASPAT